MAEQHNARFYHGCLSRQLQKTNLGGYCVGTSSIAPSLPEVEASVKLLMNVNMGREAPPTKEN
jgi:hypothetical protein